jgi:hypothetical protein
MPLILYHEEYCPPRSPQVTTKRGRQLIAVKYRLKVIRVGRATLIDPVEADEHLKQFAEFQDVPVRRSRVTVAQTGGAREKKWVSRSTGARPRPAS